MNQSPVHSHSRTLPRRILPSAVLRALSAAAVLLVALASTPTAAVLAAGSVAVSTTNDVVDGNTTSLSALVASPGADGRISLREAILAANNTASTAAVPNTITVPAGTYNLGNVGTVELQVGTATALGTNIVGAGAATTIVHQTVANQRVFDLDPSTVGSVAVSISKLTISGGTGTAFGGGGILAGWTGDSTTLDQVIITGNTTSGSNQGGGIGYGGGGTLTITNSTISNNSSDLIGGGIAFNQSSNTGNLSISNTTIANNTVSNIHGLGGGLLVTGNNTVTINNTSFSGNSIAAGGADAQGGAIQVSGGSLNLSFSRVVGNSAGSGTGSAIYTAGGATTNANDNWWGCNGGPGSICGATTVNGLAGPGTSNATRWLQLRHTPSSATLLLNGTATLTADIFGRNTGGPVAASSLANLPAFPVPPAAIFANAVRGTLSGAATQFVGGQATATYIAGGTSAACGAGSAGATADAQTITAAITIQCSDLTATKTNNVSGSAVAGQPWTWTVTIANTGNAGAAFAAGQPILADNLPNSASLSYGSPTASLAGVSCSVNASKDLVCTAASPVTLAPAATFTVQVTAVANAPGSYANPRSGGTCQVDPSGLVVESNEGNNTCSNTVTVGKAGTTTTIGTDTPDPSVVGQAVAVTYSVVPISPGAGTPTGNVTVSDGTISCTGTVAAGTCSLTFTTPGAKSLTATYAGDSSFAGSTSAAAAHTANKAGTTTTISSDTPDPSLTGQAVTVNYAVAASAPGAGTPTGNVTVSDGTVSCTGTVAAGTCSLTFTTPGAKSLTATYAGDSSFTGSTSAAAAHTVNAPNHAPVANADDYTTLEDTALTVSAANGVLKNDADPDAGDTLTAIKVTDPSHGTLALAADGSFVYTPTADFNGTDSFTYKARDNHGAESAAATVTLHVTAVNDAPSFTKGPNVTVGPGSGAYSAPWASNISAGPPDESGQTLAFQVTGNTNPGLFSAAPAIAADGTLTFTLTPAASGTATITVVLHDNGGTANGGVDTSAPQSFTITAGQWKLYVPIVMTQP